MTLEVIVGVKQGQGYSIEVTVLNTVTINMVKQLTTEMIDKIIPGQMKYYNIHSNKELHIKEIPL